MGKYRKLRKLAEQKTKGETAVFWQDQDGLITVGSGKMTEQEFDSYVEREFPSTAEIVVIGWSVTEAEDELGRGIISVEQRKRKHDRK